VKRLTTVIVIAMFSPCILLLAGERAYKWILTISGEDTKQVFKADDGISGICLNDANGEIYVFHGDKKLVRIFDLNGVMQHKFSLRLKKDYGRFSSFTVGPDGNCYMVADRIMKARGDEKETSTEILAFDYRGQLSGTLNLDDPPDGMKVDVDKIKVTPAGDLCVIDGSAARVVFYDMNGKYKSETSKKKIDVKEPETTGWFTDVAFGKDGEIFVLSKMLAKVFKFDKNGSLVKKFGKKGGAKGAFSQPCAIDVDPGGNVHVLDLMRWAVVVFNSNGKWLYDWGAPGKKDGEIYYPRLLAIDSSGHVYISDMPRRVQVFLKNDEEKVDDK